MAVPQPGPGPGNFGPRPPVGPPGTPPPPGTPQYPVPGAGYPQMPGAPPPPGAPQWGAPQMPGYPMPGAPQVPGGQPYPAPQYPPQYGGVAPAYPPGPPGAPQYPMPPQMPGGGPPSAPTYPQSPGYGAPPQPQQFGGGGVMFPGMAPPPPAPPRPPSNVPQPPGPQAPGARPTPMNLPGAPRPLPAPPTPAPPPPPGPAPASNLPPKPPKQPKPAPQPTAKTPAAPKPIPKPVPAPQPAPLSLPGATDVAAAGSKDSPGLDSSAIATVNVPPADPEEELDPAEELKLNLKKNSIPLGVSFAVHLVLIIALGLFSMPAVGKNKIVLQASITPNPGEANLADFRNFGSPDAGRPLDMDAQDKPLFTPTAKVAVAVPVSPFGVGGVSQVSSNIVGPPALAGRGMKGKLLGDYGGGQGTEDAVGLALQWLARHQLANGMWSLTGEDKGNKARYSKGSSYENQEAATAMALMAFAGAGQTHKSGEYVKIVDHAVQALLRLQDPKGNFFRGARADDALYSHAQCTIALCELLAMTKDSALKEPCQKAVQYCLESQDPVGGGWRYRPRSDSDTSVTGWMVMALQSAKNAGIAVPQENLDLISGYLDKASRGTDMSTVTIGGVTAVATKAVDYGSKYAYQPGMEFDRVMTAEGLLCRMYLGWSHDDPRLAKGCDLLIQDHLPQWKDRDVYYWYYGTQTMFHMEGKYWKEWNIALRDMLTEKQDKVGPERGSWDPLDNAGPDLWSLNKHGGRLYVTCFSAFMLEVYYRHLPLYSELKKQIEANNKKQPKSAQ